MGDISIPVENGAMVAESGVIQKELGGPIIGIEWNQTQDTWQWIDGTGASISEPDWTQTYPWSDIRRVNMASDGTINAVWGDAGYAHDGSNGDVMVEFPKFWYDYELDTTSDRIFRWWVTDHAADGFSLWPSFNHGSSEYEYLGAYEAYDTGTVLESKSGVVPTSSQTITTFRDHAQAKGSGWQQQLIWGYAMHRLLSMIFLGSMDCQTYEGGSVGDGIVDADDKHNTGADSMDDQLSTSNLGTAEGTSTGGDTPICILWVENPYGNLREFVDGFVAVDAEYRVHNRDGSWTAAGAGDWDSSDYETSSASPVTGNGWRTDLEGEGLLGPLLISNGFGGSDTTYIPDYQYSHDSGETNVLNVGGPWGNGSDAGLGSVYLNYGSTVSFSFIGSRLEYCG